MVTLVEAEQFGVPFLVIYIGILSVWGRWILLSRNFVCFLVQLESPSVMLYWYL